MENSMMAKQIADAVIQRDIAEQREGEITYFNSVATTYPNLGIEPYSPADEALTNAVNGYIQQYNETKTAPKR